MITSQCPRCSETFRLPSADLPPDAIAKCPWCGETYSADEIMGKLPPVVQLESADGQPLEFNPVSNSVAAVAFPASSADLRSDPFDLDRDEDNDVSSLASEDVFAENEQPVDLETDETFRDETIRDEVIDMEESDNQWGDLQVADSSVSDSSVGDSSVSDVESVPPTPTTPMRVNSRPRQKSKSSPIKSIIGTIGGLIIALPLAGGILLAIGKAPDLGFWPFVGQETSSKRVAAQPNNNVSNSANKWARPSRPGDLSNGLGDELQDTNERLGGSSENAAEASETTNQPMAKPSDYLADPSSEMNLESESGSVSYPKEREADEANEPLMDPEREDQPEPEKMLGGMPLPETYDENFQAENVGDLLESFALGGNRRDLGNAESKPNDPAEPKMELPKEPELEFPEASLQEPQPTTDSTMDVVSEVPANDAPMTPEMEAEIDAAVTYANQQLGNLMRFNGELSKRGGLVAFAYDAVAKVGALPGAGESENVDRLLTNITRSPLVDDLGDVANQWLDYPKRKTDGAVLVGQVTSDANGFSLQINAPSSEARSVKVSGEDLPEGQRVLAIGKIEDSSDDQTVEIVAWKAL